MIDLFGLLKSWHVDRPANATNAHGDVPPMYDDFDLLDCPGVSNIQ